MKMGGPNLFVLEHHVSNVSVMQRDFKLTKRLYFLVPVKMKLLSWTTDFDYKRTKRFNLGGWLGRRHAGFNPVNTEDPGELDHLNSDSDEVDEYSADAAESSRA